MSVTPALDRQTTLALAAAIATIALAGTGLSLTLPLLSLRMEDAGHSARFIGINTAVGGLATVLGAGFVPALARRIGSSALLLSALAIGAASLIAFQYTPIWAWFGVRVAFGWSITVLFVLSEYWINAIAPPQRRGLIMGIYATILSLGFATGPAILRVVGTDGLAPFACGAALFAVAALPVGFAGAAAPSIAGKPRIGVLGFLRGAPAATLAAFTFGAVETAAFALFPVYGTKVGLPKETAALMISALALGNVLFQIPLGLLSDRVDRRRLLIVCAAIGLAGALALPAAAGADPLALFAVLLLWGGIVAGFYTVGLALLGARYSGAELASANAAFIILYSVGSLVGPPVAGFGMDLSDPHGLAWTLALFFAFYLGALALRGAER
jgi:MFS family permease